MDAIEAFSFVEAHGVVLVAARGPVPRMTEVIAGGPIRGSWWGHPKGREICGVLTALEESTDLLVCRAVRGKATLVHRRLWPALLRAAEVLGPDRVERVIQEHSSAGHHVSHSIASSQWADADTVSKAASMSLADALDALGSWSRGAGGIGPTGS